MAVYLIWMQMWLLTDFHIHNLTLFWYCGGLWKGTLRVETWYRDCLSTCLRDSIFDSSTLILHDLFGGSVLKLKTTFQALVSTTHLVSGSYNSFSQLPFCSVFRSWAATKFWFNLNKNLYLSRSFNCFGLLTALTF